MYLCLCIFYDFIESFRKMDREKQLNVDTLRNETLFKYTIHCPELFLFLSHFTLNSAVALQITLYQHK